MFNINTKRFVYFIFLVILFPFYTIYAIVNETQESLNTKINNTKEQIELLDREIRQYQNRINQTSEQSLTLSNLIKELTLTRSKLLKEVSQTEKKIKLTSSTINVLEKDIDQKNIEINITQSVLKKSFYQMYQDDQKSFVELILIKNGLKNISQEYQYKTALNQKINTFINKTKIAKQGLETTKTKKEVENTNLKNFQQKLNLEKKAIEISKQEKDRILKETKNKESEYKKMLALQQQKRDAFEKEISDYEVQLKFLLNPKLLPSAGSGALAWPLSKIYITQLFGKTSSSGRLYASGSHSGVDFRASIGTPVMAMGTGKVLGVGNTDAFCKGASFGKWVFIQYNNGLSTTFGHLSSIIAKVGDEVKAGDIVALSGNTGHSTGPHLHVTVYASQGAEITEFASKSCPGAHFVMPVAPLKAYLDPMLYLPNSNGVASKETRRD
ncbi:peptidoglycan DD-metalloendopeptidase family protein [Candidatus Nomurabacteria bacterium]|nr:peptidoglycan DD-metalloendopeptidase family protein [Candidatus Nomurabacteria bacterium]